LASLPFPHPRQFPSEDDIRQTKLIIGQLDRKIEDLENDIKKLQTQLQQVQRKRTNYASYISPLRRLPTELLSMIIKIYLKEFGEITTIASVCSRLREVVLGMAGFWSNISLRDIEPKEGGHYMRRINGRYGCSVEGGIQCTTLEQLELVLNRVGKSPLKLVVSWPVESGTLELLADRHCPIHTLVVLDKWNSAMWFSGFHNLNLDQLQELQLRKLRWDQSRPIMDLALGSNCNRMTLDINYGSPTLELFQHELMQRVVNLGIATGERISLNVEPHVISFTDDGLMEHLYQESSGLSEISFPNVETWRLEGENGLIRSLDLSGARTVKFLSMDYPNKPIVANFPSHLTELDLVCVILAPESLQSGQRQSLPCLKSLRLEDVLFIGPFQKYFHCPRLESLTYWIPHKDVEETTIEGSRLLYKDPVLQVFEVSFFRETSALSFLHLEGTTLDVSTAPTLAACPMLRELEIKDCHINEFIHPFIRRLGKMAHFPSLKVLSIHDSWPSNAEMSHEEFMAQCGSKRPGLYYTGNGQEEYVESPSPSEDTDDADLQSSFDSMDEVDIVIESADDDE
ncbi:4243_t:CDS:2, partial [Acaulospora colombiana]